MGGHDGEAILHRAAKGNAAIGEGQRCSDTDIGAYIARQAALLADTAQMTDCKFGAITSVIEISAESGPGCTALHIGTRTVAAHALTCATLIRQARRELGRASVREIV